MNPSAKSWNEHVMTTYREMKKRSPSTRLGDAMKAAKRTWKGAASTRKGARKSGGRRNRKATRRNRH